MKTAIVFLVILALAKSLCVAQPSTQLPILQVTGFDRSGALTWTNRLCATQPVYEVLRAGSVTGAWEHVAFITNRTSVTLTTPLTNEAGFFRLAWVDDTPILFDYAFDEGYGFTAVTGRLSIALFRFPAAGSWACEETEYAIDESHPTGTGQLMGEAIVTITGEEGALFYLRRGLDNAFFLEGALQREQVGGQCVYTQFVGTVYNDTIVGAEPIGTFVATRSP